MLGNRIVSRKVIGDWLKSEETNGSRYSRDNIVIAKGSGKLLTGTVLGLLAVGAALVTPFVRRNMFKMLIVGTLSVIIILYVGTDIAPWVTQSFTQSNIDLPKDFTAVTNMTGAVSTWIGWVAVKIGELFNMIA